jgi:hypothetical protein
VTEPRTRVLAVAAGVAAIALAAVVVAWVVTSPGDYAAPDRGLKVDWGTGDARPGCVYDPASQTVEAALTITGESSRPQEVTVIVTAYADENTSQPVGSNSTSARVDGPVDTVLRVTIPVDSAPHVGEDDVAACGREVKYTP